MMIKILNWIKKVVFKVDIRPMLEILKENGLIIGDNCSVMDECIIDPGHCWLIRIGNEVTLAPRVHILAHDASTKRSLGYTYIAPVTIGNNVFIGAGSAILPGVSIGDNVVIGAHSVVTKSIPNNCVAVGNPAKVIKKYNEYIVQKKDLMESVPVYGVEYTIGNISKNNMIQMREELNNKGGFVI